MKKTILSIITIIFLLSACAGQGDNLPLTNKDIFKGTDGIKINFLDNAPPTDIYEEKNFRVGLSVRNAGASFTAVGDILIGYESDYMTLDGAKTQSINLEGRSLHNIYGEEEKYFFDFTSGTVDEMTTHHLSNIYATACYLFQTIASTAVCVDTDIYDEKQSDKVCTSKDHSLSSQGGPVAVKKIEYDMIPIGDNEVKPVFKIWVQNVGNGMVIEKNSISEACSSSSLTREDDLGIISVNVELGDQRLDCSPIPMKLQKDQDYVRCELTEGISTDFITYQSILKITLDYGYTFTVSKSIDIKNR